MYLYSHQAAACGRRQGFALRELLALLCSVGVLFALGCPWINQARTTTSGNGCLRNIRQLGLAVSNHESAVKRFPLVSDAPGPLNSIPPGTDGGNRSESSGYGWLATALPYIEEIILYDRLRDASRKFSVSPFAETVVVIEGGDHISSRPIPAFRCPSYSGDTQVRITYGSEYDDLHLPGNPPAVANYVAIVGTHVNRDGTINENGVLVSKCAIPEDMCAGKGLKLQEISDGFSQTIVACETIEPIYSAWIDGQATWVVGIKPDRAGLPDPDGFATASEALLGVGGDPLDTYNAYSELGLRGASGWPGVIPRHWGPSSEHAGGVVLHVFADAHAAAISPDIDPTVYYRLITRNGGEPNYTGDL